MCPNRRANLPRSIRVRPDAIEGGDGIECFYIPAPFRFCPHCGVAYGFRQGTGFGKVSTLGSEGRSTATSILSLSTIRALRQQATLPPHAASC